MSAHDRVEGRERLLESLGIPTDGSAAQAYIARGGPVNAAKLGALIDEDVAIRLFREWNPAETPSTQSSSFRLVFAGLLAAGASIGYALGRFRDVSRNLPDADAEPERWVELFEQAVMARNALDLRVRLSGELHTRFMATNTVEPAEANRFDSKLADMSRDLFYELGIVVPRVEVLADESLSAEEFVIEINDARLPPIALPASDHELVNSGVDYLEDLKVQGTLLEGNEVLDFECSVIDSADAEACKGAGLTTWTPLEVFVLSLTRVVRNMAGAFVNRALVEFFAERLSQTHPLTVEELWKVISKDATAHLLRGLVDERLSIRNLLQIFDVLALPETGVETDPDHMSCVPFAVERFLCDSGASATERRLSRVRRAMKRYISHKYSDGGAVMMVITVARDLEKRLKQPEPLSDDERSSLVRAVRSEVSAYSTYPRRPPIITTSATRSRLFREIRADLPEVSVIAYEEISVDVSLHPVARVEPEDGVGARD